MCPHLGKQVCSGVALRDFSNINYALPGYTLGIVIATTTLVYLYTKGPVATRATIVFTFNFYVAYDPPTPACPFCHSLLPPALLVLFPLPPPTIIPHPASLVVPLPHVLLLSTTHPPPLPPCPALLPRWCSFSSSSSSLVPAGSSSSLGRLFCGKGD